MTHCYHSNHKAIAWYVFIAVGSLLIISGFLILLNIAIPSPTPILNDDSPTNANSITPIALDNLPDDLKNPGLQFAGIYEDGWLSESFTVSLSPPPSANTLIIRGTIPSLDNPGFSTQIQVNIDNTFVGGKNIGVGEFELKVPSLASAGDKLIQITFSEQQILPNGDRRKVAAKLLYIGFESRKDLTAKLPRDITEKGIILGQGWYLPEESGNRIFRWVNNQAEFSVKAPEIEAPQAVYLDIEPGPGVGLKPFDLTFLNASDRVVAQRRVAGRSVLKVLLPTLPGKSSTYKLVTQNGGNMIEGEKRVLNFRVFQARFWEAPPDIYAVRDGLSLGSGWYEPETVRGKTFRWVNNDAEFSVTALHTQTASLSMELEPGPGLGGRPFELQLLSDTGAIISKATVNSLEQIKFRLNCLPGKTENFRLHVDEGGQPLTGDSRTLNFRVFNIRTGLLKGF